MFSSYLSPLVRRYASREMAELFSPLSYARAWRKVWLVLAEAQRDVGAPITDAQIESLRATMDTIDLARVAEIEAETRHDVMAHLRAWGEICPEAKPIMHLGATSQYVNDNAEALLLREATGLVRDRIVNVLRALTTFAEREKDRPTLGYTHFQPAQLVTAGKRATLWISDLVHDLNDVSMRLEEIPCRGAKGTTGTQASYLDLLGSARKVRELDQGIALRLGFAKPEPVTGQTTSRKHDVRLLDALAGVSVSVGKLGRDVRLLMHTGELREPFREKQVGSSAMPYKRNPILAERLCALARIVTHHRNAIAEMAASQWLERSLDDSATRRVSMPDAFLAADGMLRVAYELASGLQVDEARTRAIVDRHLPFMVVEKVLNAVVKSGGDRQEAHERLREHAMAVYANPDKVSFVELLKADPAFKNVSGSIKKLMKAEKLTGLARQQVEEFLKLTVRPLLERHRDTPAMVDTLRV